MAKRLFLDEGQLREVGFDPRMVATFRKLAEFVDTQTRLAEAEATAAALDGTVATAEAAIVVLDGRVDTLEAAADDYVLKTGDTMSGALNVNALLECDTLKVNTAPTVAAAVASTHKVAVDFNGVTYYVLVSNV